MPSRNQGSALIVVLSITFGVLLIMAIAAWLYFRGNASVALVNGPHPSLAPRDTTGTLGPLVNSGATSPHQSVAASPTVSPLTQVKKDTTCSSGLTKVTDRLVENGEVSSTSVDQALKNSGATCKNAALYTSQNEKVLFYRLGGCYGKSQDQIKKQIADQSTIISTLKKNYWVLEVACDPNVLP